MLAAAGTPIDVMRKAVVTEIAMPLLGGVAIAVVTSVAVTKMFFAAASTQSFDGRPVPIPVGPFVRVACSPSLRPVWRRRPRSLPSPARSGPSRFGPSSGVDHSASVVDAKVGPMDAAVWTAIGLLATFSLGSLFYLGSRIDSLMSRMDSRFDSMEGRFDALIARMDSRFDSVDARLDGVNARVDAHLDRHAG